MMIQLSKQTIAELCLTVSRVYGDKPALTIFRDGKQDDWLSYKSLGEKALQFGLSLRNLGINPGDRVLLLSDNCPEWPIAYFGIAIAGAVSVPLLTGFSEEQVQNIATHSGVSAVVLGHGMEGKLGMLSKDIPVIFLDEEKMDIVSSFSDSSLESLPERRPEDLATIIYTSGTSGNSKGVMLSNLNLISCAFSLMSLVKFTTKDRILSVLPLAHAYECSLALLTPIMGGSSIAYLDRPPSPSILLPAAAALKPTIMATVPLFIEKMYRNGVAPKLRKNALFRFPLTRVLAMRFAGRKMNAALGGKIRFFGIGGAPLSEEVELFLRRARFPYAVGYGLTEASPLIAGSVPFSFPFRSTGTAIEGVEVRIADNGEILARGPNIMMGYYQNEEQTAETFTSDGWLKTGDLGSMDANGKLYIKGRIKALILGPGGENIYPEEIEGLLSTSTLVEEALVYSDDKGKLVALVILSEAAAAAISMADKALEELRAWANKKLSSFSRLDRIEIRCEPFEKTPTMKIKRYLYA
ncbi:MAG: AMP-binding protein [Treponema sp.]|nr:AMP-binding protein [Treponema sp.]